MITQRNNDGFVVSERGLGFTLVELMIIVAIIGILAAVAGVAYTAYIRRSRNAEATSVLADIRLKQEAYRGTFRQYCNLNGDGWLPRSNPNGVSVAWVADGSDPAWRQLGVVPDGKVYFQYNGLSGFPNAAVGNYATFDTELGDNWHVSNHWHGATALQDLDADGNCEGFRMVSGATALSIVPAGACNTL